MGGLVHSQCLQIWQRENRMNANFGSGSVYSDKARSPTQSSVRALVNTWLGWRLPAAIGWYWLLSAIMYKASGVDLLPCWGWMVLIPIIILVLKVFQDDPIAAVWFGIYLILFPIIMLGSVAWRLPKTLAIPLKVFRAMTNKSAALTSFCLLIITSLLLLVTDKPSVAVVGAIIETAMLLLILLIALRWAIDPLNQFVMLVSLFPWVRNFIDKNAGGSPKSPEEESKSRNTNIQFLSLVERTLHSVTEGIEMKVRRSVMLLFTGVFFLLWLTVVTGYAITLYSVQSFEQQPFEKLEAGFLNCYLYSLSVITTAPRSDVIPKTLLAQFLYASELCSAILLLTVFISIFSAAMGLHGDERIQQIVDGLKNVYAWVDDSLKDLKAKQSHHDLVVVDTVPTPAQQLPATDGNIDTNKDNP